MQSTVIREAREADAAGIADVHVAAWRTTYRGLVPDAALAQLSTAPRERFWRELLANPAAPECVFVAEDADDAIVGFASGGPERDGSRAYDGELYAIYLLESYQRRGLGRRLTLAVARRLRDAGHESMLVWVLAANPARRFYEALGGQFVATKPVQIGGATLEEVAYGWTDLERLADELDARGA